MDPLGIYNRWDDVPFTEQTAEDLTWFFKVNVVVSYGCFLRGLCHAGSSQYSQGSTVIFRRLPAPLEAHLFLFAVLPYRFQPRTETNFCILGAIPDIQTLPACSSKEQAWQNHQCLIRHGQHFR
jgi:hypothetical protein